MDKEHWLKLIRLNYSVIVLLPEDKWKEIYLDFIEEDQTEYANNELMKHLRQTKKAVNNMTIKVWMEEVLTNEAKELLKDPSYDLKEWDDG